MTGAGSSPEQENLIRLRIIPIQIYPRLAGPLGDGFCNPHVVVFRYHSGSEKFSIKFHSYKGCFHYFFIRYESCLFFLLLCY
jgi:hypothetical protein